MAKSVFKRSVIGFLFGIFIGNAIAFLTKSGNGRLEYSPEFVALMGGMPMAFIIQSLVSGFYGAVCMGGTIVYDIEEWPLALSSVVHYLICAVLYIPISILMTWANSLTELLIMEAIQLVVYSMIWLIMYLRYKAEIRELNELMNEKRNNNSTFAARY